jgi:hypothetical protein
MAGGNGKNTAVLPAEELNYGAEGGVGSTSSRGLAE